MRTSPGRAAILLAAVVATAFLGLRATVLPPADDDSEAAPQSAGAACPAEGRIGSASHGERSQLPASGYAFLFAAGEGDCFPARFNPCQPVPYVLNDALAPPGGVADVREAFARLEQATGIAFVEESTTDEKLAISRDSYQPERYGQRWAPILVGWSALGAGLRPDAGDDVIVVGRGRPLRVDNVLVSGVLELNVDAVLDRTTGTPLPSGFGAGVTQGRVILHELGHVVGLGHVSGRAQLMYPELGLQTSPTAEFGIGDLAGLRLLGTQAGCVGVPPLPA